MLVQFIIKKAIIIFITPIFIFAKDFFPLSNLKKNYENITNMVLKIFSLICFVSKSHDIFFQRIENVLIVLLLLSSSVN